MPSTSMRCVRRSDPLVMPYVLGPHRHGSSGQRPVPRYSEFGTATGQQTGGWVGRAGRRNVGHRCATWLSSQESTTRCLRSRWHVFFVEGTGCETCNLQGDHERCVGTQPYFMRLLAADAADTYSCSRVDVSSERRTGTLGRTRSSVTGHGSGAGRRRSHQRSV